MFTRDTTYLDPPETDVCDDCDDFHEDEIPWCSCRCHWDAEDYRIEALNLAGEDV